MSELDAGRLEIFLKVERSDEPGESRKVRASGPREDMYELVEWFESHTGLRFDHPAWRDRVRRGPKPLAGQLALGTHELSSDATVVDDGD